MGIYENIIDIDNCFISIIDSYEAEKFIYDNYLYSEEYNSKRREFLGVFYNNELIEVLQYKKIDNNYIIEIRCIKLNTYIEGDIKYFIEHFKYFKIIVDRSFEFYHTNILIFKLKLNPKVLNKETYILNSGYYILESRKG